MVTTFRKQILAFFLLFIGLCSFAQVKSGAYRVMLKGLLSHSVPELNVQQALGLANSALFLDAREPKEYAVSHIHGAIPIGYDKFDLQQLPQWQKDQPLVVYCSVGFRSEKVAEKLLKAGYTRVYNLYGGIFEWVNQGNPVEDASGPTEKVHAYNRTWGIWLRHGKKIY